MFKWIIKIFFRWFYRVRPPEMVKYGQASKGYARGKIIKAPDGSVQMEIQGEKYPFPGHPRAHVLLNGTLNKMKELMKKYIFHAIFDEIPKGFSDEHLNPFLKDLWRVFTLMEEAEITGDMKSQVRNLKKATCFFLQESTKLTLKLKIMLGVMTKIVKEASPDMFPEEQLCPFVKEVWRAITDLKGNKLTETMKKAGCYFLQEDDAWRFRSQWAYERLNRKLSKNISIPFDKNDWQATAQFIIGKLDYKKCRLGKVGMYYLRGKWFRPDKFTKKGNLKYEY